MAAAQTGAYHRIAHFHSSWERQLMMGCEKIDFSFFRPPVFN
jgi:hypothetical protein